ncbi:MAG: rRNA maturation RNase YbeY [Armatimonadetes bacterium]|nr:rRNA maturation RNase YbeY [Armatimonadota bacterium]
MAHPCRQDLPGFDGRTGNPSYLSPAIHREQSLWPALLSAAHQICEPDESSCPGVTLGWLGSTVMSASVVAPMNVSITGEAPSGFSLDSLTRTLRHVLRSEGAPEGWEVSVLLTDDGEMSVLHNRWMGLDGPTDVMSFPLDNPHTNKGLRHGCLGDIAVSVDTAQRQADDHGHSLEIELTLLVVHGALHLLGYDDIEEVARKEMRAKERHYVPEAFRASGPRSSTVR